ncbi:hypothetical protein SteCoe_34770 [Stentor coeruleus]|uniref:Potassium channel domain-containing protein n=1 Tax=Stentor coeruleus TaxID=5963 RepID=A0A1R2ATX7_9CILI|nr:hypothetical protein SteCoe_34770 [Stentor coeruleus]
MNDSLENQNTSFLLAEKQQRRLQIKIHSNYFKKWRMFRFLSAFFGCLAIIPAIISYEIGFSPNRTYDQCEINTENQNFLRFSILILSYTGIAMQIPLKHYYYKWIRLYPFTFEELPPSFKPTYLEIIEMTRKRKPLEYILDHNTYLVTILFLIFPYPEMYTKIYFNQQIKYNQYVLCYYLEEIFYFVMFLRVFYLLFSAFSYGQFQNPMAYRICESYRIKISSMYSVKCYSWMYPMEVLLFVFLIPGLIVFGIGTRIFERTIKFNGMNFDSLENSMWCIIVTMMTVGYGDTIPHSNLARGVICLSIFWGGIILSLTFVTLGNMLKLNPKETLAFKAILATKESGHIICEKLTERLLKEDRLKGWRAFEYKLSKFFNPLKKYQLSEETRIYRETATLSNRIEKIDKIADSLRHKLKKLSKEL